MSKKDFTGNFNSLLGTSPAVKEKPAPKKKATTKKAVAKSFPTKEEKPSPPAKKKAKPVSKKKAPVDSTRDGTKEGEKRASFIVKEETVAKIKAIAYQDRKNIKEVVAEALEAYLQLWEKENGAI